MPKKSPIDTIDNFLNKAVQDKIIHLENESENLTGNKVQIEGQEKLNFGSCVYLGLEFNEQIRKAAKDAIDQFGTQFASSRAYLSSGQYSTLEQELSQIFDDCPVLVTPTTTLGHLSAIPTLVHKDDLVILDHQVHASVQMASENLKGRGNQVSIIRHNDLDKLEAILDEEHRHQRYNNVWYFADGIYSMYGDTAPFQALEALTEKYERFYLYIDDAHGMSWTGDKGCGMAFSQLNFNRKTVLIVSLCKSFAAAGGALVFRDPELKRKVKTCGGTMIFSGPVQPPMLGAAIASAQLHQTAALQAYQAELQEKIEYTLSIIQSFRLPLASENPSPIFFIGLGLPQVGYNMVRRLLDEGYFVNLGMFPAVPIKNTGIRFTITNHHSFQDIYGLIETIAYHLPLALNDERKTYQEIARAFNLDLDKIQNMPATFASNGQPTSEDFQITYASSINSINTHDWNSVMGTQGSFNWEGMKFLEQTFGNEEDPANHWHFHYFFVKDENQNIVIATFLTEALVKDDMLSDHEISETLEQQRVYNPYYMTSKTLMMGSLLTEGQHLYVDKEHPAWKKALTQLLNRIEQLQDETDSEMLQLRDFHDEAKDLEAIFLNHGFFKSTMPDTHVIPKMHWTDQDGFLKQLGEKSRRYQRKEVLPYRPYFSVYYNDPNNEELIDHFHQLYLNVQSRNKTLNTFPLPKLAFRNMVKHPNWDIITLYLDKNKVPNAPNLPVAVGFCYNNGVNYCPMVLGLDYTYNRTYSVYRVSLYETIMRGWSLGLNQMFLGFGASMEKRRMGAQIIPQAVYIQNKDNYKMAYLQNLEHKISQKPDIQ